MVGPTPVSQPFRVAAQATPLPQSIHRGPSSPSPRVSQRTRSWIRASPFPRQCPSTANKLETKRGGDAVALLSVYFRGRSHTESAMLIATVCVSAKLPSRQATTISSRPPRNFPPTMRASVHQPAGLNMTREPNSIPCLTATRIIESLTLSVRVSLCVSLFSLSFSPGFFGRTEIGSYHRLCAHIDSYRARPSIPKSPEPSPYRRDSVETRSYLSGIPTRSMRHVADQHSVQLSKELYWNVTAGQCFKIPCRVGPATASSCSARPSCWHLRHCTSFQCRSSIHCLHGAQACPDTVRACR